MVCKELIGVQSEEDILLHEKGFIELVKNILHINMFELVKSEEEDNEIEDMPVLK